MKTDVCIVGAGPAGLMAAICAARQGAAVTVVEASRTAGRKLLATGGGRCNLTHDADVDELVRAFGPAGRFLRHSFHEMPPDAVRAFFHNRGLPTMVESNGCVFPAQGRAVDVLRILLHEAEHSGVRLLYENPVAGIISLETGFTVIAGRHNISARSVLIATGGLSWPQTGSTGDGYRLARNLGHSIITPKAALVPLVVRESWPAALTGVALSDVRITGEGNLRKLASRGAIVFTQDGIGGPAAQDASRLLADDLADGAHEIAIHIDLIPATDAPELDRQLQDRFAASSRKSVSNVLAEFVPRRLAAMLCTLAGCEADLQANQLRRDLRKTILKSLKGLPLNVTGTRPIAEATVTRGGVRRQEIDPVTMASKVCPGLYFAGEVIDADGPCGGYNLQMCFSTGALAGRSAVAQLADR